MTAPTFNGCLPHRWTAEILPQRPMILPSRHYVYPAAAEEVEKGALEVLIQPGDPAGLPFLATCALGFRDPAAPTGLWSTPNPEWLCAVAGGYAYLIDTGAPERFTMVRYRPVLNVLCYQPDSAQSASQSNAQRASQSLHDEVQSASLLLFVGHHTILAWGREGEVWESERLSWEGVIVDGIEGSTLRGKGWDLRTDQDLPFALDLRSGQQI